MRDNPLVNLAQALLRRTAWFSGVFQAVLITGSLALAWMLRFDFSVPHRRMLLLAMPVLMILRLLAFRRFGLLRGWWSYAGPEDMLRILKAVGIGSGLFLLAAWFMPGLQGFPRSVYLLEPILTASLLGATRVFSRLLAESVRQDLAAAKKVVVIGAGTAAQMVFRELQRPSSGYQVTGCFDDDRMKIGLKILGVPVLGRVDEMAERVGALGAQEILIAVPSATGAQMNRFVELSERTGLRYRTIPPLRELIIGDVLLDQIREVNLDDLLGREAVALDLEALQGHIEGKVVMVTGAAGSIGSELCRQILEYAPATLVCLDQDETGVFHLQAELQTLCATSRLVFRVGDVRDRERLRKVCATSRTEIIFHAAAYKHVPMMEANIEEAIENNMMGLLVLLDVAEETHVRDLIMISSDKAVNPTSVMGATKRICELVLASRPANGLRCVSVRFGNVLGSNGSVIPIFQDQLRRNMPITVTHPEIERFFMTTQEAASLVLQAFAIGSHGDILVLDMGKPVKIVELARRLIHLAGKTEEQVPIRFTGLRPGEKLYEDLFYPTEEVLETSHPKIRHTRFYGPNWTELMVQLKALRQVALTGTVDEIRATIKQIVPEYDPTGENVVYKARSFAAGSRG
jgi:FlaA1/EpsC-like NDP-sugar epimerase